MELILAKLAKGAKKIWISPAGPIIFFLRPGVRFMTLGFGVELFYSSF